ncbi:MAG TPA: RNA polymerase sigma factor [Gammaproteobacteria bacterium]|nr:RNA polymerase sigma factor [Gammaproteobacteria bacterium]
MHTATGTPIDPALVAGARGGSESARAALYTALATGVFTLVRRILGSESLAEDVLQDTFVEVFTKLEELRDDAAIAGWVRRIAVNRALSHLRSSWVSKRVDWAPEDFQALASATVPHSDCARLEAALDALPHTARAVVWLYDVEGYTHQEIADLMGRSVSFSKSRLSRAHASLREYLGANYRSADIEIANEGTELCVGRLKTI